MCVSSFSRMLTCRWRRARCASPPRRSCAACNTTARTSRTIRRHRRTSCSSRQTRVCRFSRRRTVDPPRPNWRTCRDRWRRSPSNRFTERDEKSTLLGEYKKKERGAHVFVVAKASKATGRKIRIDVEQVVGVAFFSSFLLLLLFFESR